MTTVDGTAAAQALAAPKKKSFFGKMYAQVIVAVVVGGLLGYFHPNLAVELKPLGDAFIKTIKMVITPIIFATIVVGIAKMGDMRRIADVGIKSIIYFEVASTLALIIGMVVINVWPIGSGINADPAAFDSKLVESYAKRGQELTIISFIMNIIPNAFLEPFVRGDMLQVVFLATLFGFAVILTGDRGKPVVDLLDRVTSALFSMVRIIMYIAPIGAFGAMAFTIGKFGIKTLLDLGQLVAGIYLVSVLFIVIVLGGFLRWVGFSIWQVMAHFKDEWLFVFAATSAETMMPRCMEKLEKLGVSKEVVGLVMPSGFSFNTDGTAIYMTMAIMFMAHATGTELSIAQQLTILFVMLFTSKGAAGVAGAGFVALAATLPTISVIPIGALALLLGVDRFMAEIRAFTNLMSNVIATLIIGRWVGAVDYERATAILAGRMEAE